MLHIGNEIKKVIESNHLVKQDVAEQLGVTPTYLARMFNQSDMKCSSLDKVCKVIGLSAAHIFEQESQVNVQNVSANSIIGNAKAELNVTPGEVATLRELLDEKERTIRILLAQIGTKTGQTD
ncbi:MAG: helix-turn-helix transcriptional regulator [Prevotella sp.]|nr:helix-turn-helix transcriptional regulator [Prevotella sp.]